MLLFMWFENKFIESVSFFVFGGSHYTIFTLSNICLLEVAGDKTGSYMPLIYAFFGSGALLSPLIIRELKVETYWVLFLFNMLMVAMFYYYPSPTN